MELDIDNVFEDNLKRGKLWEEHIIRLLNSDPEFRETIFKNVKFFSFEENPEKQKSGIDGSLELTYEYDAKVRLASPLSSRPWSSHNWYNKDILFEFDSPMGDILPRKDGWHKKHLKRAKESDYKKITVVIYCWETEDGKRLEPIGYAIFYTKEFCEWITDEGKNFFRDVALAPSIREENGTQWYTRNKSMTISDGSKFFHGFDANRYQLEIIDGKVKRVNYHRKKKIVKRINTLDGWLNGNE